MARIIRYAEQAATPWKNGGGLTVELLCEPKGASMNAFDYRISVATISKDGPFSSFPGIDRTLALVEGAGVTLNLDGRIHRIDEEHPLISFAGEAQVHATVNDGTTMDFNVMTQRIRCRHEVEIVYMGSGRTIEPKGDLTLVFLARGEHLHVGCLEPKGELHKLGERDAILLDPGCVWMIAGFSTVSLIVDIYAEPCTTP